MAETPKGPWAATREVLDALAAEYAAHLRKPKRSAKKKPTWKTWREKPGMAWKRAHPLVPENITTAAFYEHRQANLRYLGFDSYLAYRASNLWHRVRERVLILDRWKCRCCGAKATEVHHTAYHQKTLMGTDLSHVHSVCHSCHEAIEFVDVKAGVRRSPFDMVAETRDRISRFQGNGGAQERPGKTEPQESNIPSDSGTAGGPPARGVVISHPETLSDTVK